MVVIQEKHKNLVKLYIKYVELNYPDGDSWNSFLKYAKVPKDERTFSTCAAILQQVFFMNLEKNEQIRANLNKTELF